MWFNSFEFWIFFALVALGCRLMRHAGQNRWLLLASYFFYGCYDWRFLSLILFCTWVNFIAGRRIHEAACPRARRRWLTAGVTLSLAVLGVFKYLGFFTREASRLLMWAGLADHRWALEVLLPAGISFFTFQALSYTMDIYRAQTKPCRSFSDFALYISFFPQLVAGPIERSSHLLPQVEQPRPRCDEARFRKGFYLVLSGLFLKVVIADNMAWLAGHVFAASPSSLAGPEVLLGVYAFAFQIYGDFAGYSAIACGTACWLGFDLMTNFRRPYFALDPRDFWQRWHISLSTWLRDYLYIPIGGNRGGGWGTARNLMLTMLLGGLWHGAAWTFIVWGGIHGLWLGLHRVWLRVKKPVVTAETRPSAPWWLAGAKWFVTFHLVCLTWLAFRADSLRHALALLGALGGKWEVTDFTLTCAGMTFFFLLPWLAYEFWLERRKDDEALLKSAWWWRAGLYVYLVLMMICFPPPAPAEFIYFRF
ncbi:MAG TPA: membrane-bound O-acyltransferase family protein [Verrucomicrobiales bacterium]|nr:membrane-bound O-acyltransferase family protein [Verrucomicrobiales bacterium]HRJ10215.1 MBOAT family O-acyltransferase [Prosthecobacter sp.]HRK16100.1 MBOAT family O-acyltransferase [Prosthecobacter sp.]